MRDALAVTVIALVLLAAVPSGVAGLQADEGSNPETGTLESEVGDVHYNVTFYEWNSTVRIEGHNRGKSLNASHVITVDETTVEEVFNEVSQGERWTHRVNVSDHVDAFRENHEVRVSTWGDSVSFAFERDIDVSNSETVPVPNVTDVSVTSTEYLGETQAAVNFTLHNPSLQPYLVRIMVDTRETNGLIRAKGLRNRTTSSIILPLNQPPGDVLGEVRIYSGRANEPEDAVAQVEFRGSTNGTTNFERESYVPVPEPSNAPEGQQYRYRPSDGQGWTDGEGIAAVAEKPEFVAVIFALLLVGLWWRRR